MKYTAKKYKITVFFFWLKSMYFTRVSLVHKNLEMKFAILIEIINHNSQLCSCKKIHLISSTFFTVWQRLHDISYAVVDTWCTDWKRNSFILYKTRLEHLRERIREQCPFRQLITRQEVDLTRSLNGQRWSFQTRKNFAVLQNFRNTKSTLQLFQLRMLW